MACGTALAEASEDEAPLARCGFASGASLGLTGCDLYVKIEAPGSVRLCVLAALSTCSCEGRVVTRGESAWDHGSSESEGNGCDGGLGGTRHSSLIGSTGSAVIGHGFVGKGRSGGAVVADEGRAFGQLFIGSVAFCFWSGASVGLQFAASLRPLSVPLLVAGLQVVAQSHVATIACVPASR